MKHIYRIKYILKEVYFLKIKNKYKVWYIQSKTYTEWDIHEVKHI